MLKGEDCQTGGAVLFGRQDAARINQHEDQQYPERGRNRRGENCFRGGGGKAGEGGPGLSLLARLVGRGAAVNRAGVGAGLAKATCSPRQGPLPSRQGQGRRGATPRKPVSAPETPGAGWRVHAGPAMRRQATSGRYGAKFRAGPILAMRPRPFPAVEGQAGARGRTGPALAMMDSGGAVPGRRGAVRDWRRPALGERARQGPGRAAPSWRLAGPARRDAGAWRA